MEREDILLSAMDRARILNLAMSGILENYVFRDKADQIVEALRTHLNQGDYDHITSSVRFCSVVTDHLQAASHDKHLRLYMHDDEHSGEKEDAREKIRRREIANNFGFHKLERLAGNIGYMDLRSFSESEAAAETAVHAMNFLANTDALVIDLRHNGGGVPSMLMLLCSYLLPEELTHLESFYLRPEDRTQQFWTLPYVPGRRYLNKPVYILTSHETFSGGEAFAYDLKYLKRAVVIGERTAGGAHPGKEHPLTEFIDIFIPAGRSINPITDSNWEGIGVEPDIETLSADALRVAHQHALKQIQSSKKEMSEFQRSEISVALKDL